MSLPAAADPARESLGSPTLAQLQSQLQAHLLSPAEQRDDAIAAAIRPGTLGVSRRLAIYHHAYRARLTETLADTFGHTATYLGED